MASVFIVIHWDYNQTNVEKVFSTAQNAIDYLNAKTLKDETYSIEEYNVDGEFVKTIKED
jgi:hypothetical protein